MSRNNYTIALCDIIENIWNEGHPEETHSIYEMNGLSNLLNRMDEKIEYALPIIFQFTFPCYGDADDKEELEKHIIRAYFTRNINTDSVARWILFLRDRLEDIMPKYVAIYNAQAQLIASEILNPYHITETKSGNIDTARTKKQNITDVSSSESTSSADGSSSGTDNTNVSTVNKFSNTPQALASTGQDYLTNMTKEDTENANTFENNSTSLNNSRTGSESATDSSEQSNENKVEDYTKIIKGNMSRSNYAELIKQYEDVILNIEEMITNELRDLFYLMY